jgi:hypothetical protein
VTVSSTATTLVRPRIEPARDCQGVYVLLPSGHGWLLGSRQQALHEFALLERIERTGFAQKRRS